VIASKRDMKCDNCGEEKHRRRRNSSVDDFDALEIRRGKSTKFDGAELVGYMYTCIEIQ